MEKKTLKMIRGSKERPQDVKEKLSEWGALTIFTDMDWLMNEHVLFYVSDRKTIVGVPDNDSILECLNYEVVPLPKLKKKADEEIQLPETWEEFCTTHNLKKEKEYYINSDSKILSKDYGGARLTQFHKNLLPNKETAKAVLALCQLIQLRDCYNEGWQPDWMSETEIKYGIEPCNTGFIINKSMILPQILFFKTAELRDEFYKNFIDLIEKIKPLFGIMEGGEK